MALLDKGVSTGSSADPHVLRLLPPLVLTDQEVVGFLAVLNLVLKEVNE